MLENHRYLLFANRNAIVQDLIVEDVLTYLRGKFILNAEDSEIVLSEKSSRKKAEKLLDLLPEKGYDAFGCFYDSLLEKYLHLAQLLVATAVVTSEEEGGGDGSVFVDDNYSIPMTAAHRKLLTAKRVDIVEDLLVDDVLMELKSKFVFDQSDLELIRHEKTSKRKAEKLLDLLVTKGDAAFEHFLQVLQDQYPHIAELLENEDSTRTRHASLIGDPQDIVESRLLKGGVPQRPTVITHRPRRIHSLRTALKSLKDRDAWVVLHGMAGCGKTILASEAVRNISLLEDFFPGGVFWTNIGPVDRPKLLMKMQNLCSRLDEDKLRPLPRNLEEARDRLKTLFSHQYPRSLLVVDDLWSAHDARYFNIRARVLVTTRDVGIAQCIEGVKCPVFVPAELTYTQCLDILAQWTEKKRSELPNEASKIIHECGSHVLAISMIGALLKAHPTRWFYYWSQLHNHKLSKVKTKFAYDYPSLSEAIAVSIESLSDELREKYQDFVLFDSSMDNIPLKVFCLLWDIDKEDVEDIMEEFSNKSLLKSACRKDNEHQQPGYTVHNLQVNYLLENCTDILDRHKKLVMAYSKACGGNFSNLEDDGYVFYYLLHHLLQAECWDIAKDLLTNLTWVSKKLQVAGPADLINDYINLFKMIKEEQKGDLKTVEDFYQFVRTNAHLFVSRPMFDVIQAALSEPGENKVYQQAKMQASKNSGRLYLDWCNKHKENVYSLEMTLKPHNGAVSCCQFSSDGKFIVSSSSDETAKVWEAASGRVVHSLDHDGVVTSCAFNCDNSKIVTTSYDTSVKIWNLGLHSNLILTYNDHKQDVYCAAFCPVKENESVVVSCSADHSLRIWNGEDGHTIAVCKGHSDVVRWCCFSQNGENIASASHDQTVKIWRRESGECLATTAKHDTFVSYCCFNNDCTCVFSSSASSIKIWNGTTGEILDSFDINHSILAFSLSHCGNKIAFALDNAEIQLWDLKSKKELTTYNGHKNWVHTVSFSPDDSHLVSGSADETIKLWPTDTTAYAKKAKLQKIFDVFFAEDHDIIIAVADSQNRIKIFEGVSGQQTRESECNKSKINHCIFSPDGKNLAIALKSGKIKILSVENCEYFLEFDGHESGVNFLCFDQSGAKLLSCGDDGKFMMWGMSFNGNNTVLKDKQHSDAITKVLFFDNDSKIVTASKDGTAKVWTSNANLLFECHHEENGWVLSCQPSPDSQILVTGTVNNVVKIWDSSTGAELYCIRPHKDCVRSLSISNNNDLIATGSDDGTLVISSVKSGHQIISCTPRRESWVTDVIFSHDSSQLVSIGNGIHWHQVSNGSLLQRFCVKGSYLGQIKTSKDFKTFITVDNLGILYILKVIS